MEHSLQNRIAANFAEVYGEDGKFSAQFKSCDEPTQAPPQYDSDFDWKTFEEAVTDFSAVVQRVSVETVFKALAQEWKSRRSHSSCVQDMALDLSYQQIIGLGPAAIPLLLAELERAPDHWFWALFAITRHDPVPEQSRGNVKKMAAAWIEWGKHNGIRW